MKYFLPALALLSLPVAAHTPPADTLRYYNMEEAVVTATPKETTRFRQQPVSAAVFGKKQIEAIDAKSIKHLGTFAPNFYMPDYGSRIHPRDRIAHQYAGRGALCRQYSVF